MSKLEDAKKAYQSNPNAQTAADFVAALKKAKSEFKLRYDNNHVLLDIMQKFAKDDFSQEAKTLLFANADKFLSEFLAGSKAIDGSFFLWVNLLNHVGIKEAHFTEAEKRRGGDDLQSLCCLLICEIYSRHPIKKEIQPGPMDKFLKPKAAQPVSTGASAAMNYAQLLQQRIVAYTNRDAFTEENLLFADYLDLAVSLDQLKQAVLTVVKQQINDAQCDNPKYLILWLAKHFVKHQQVDLLLQLLNQKHNLFDENELLKFNFAREALLPRLVEVHERVRRCALQLKLESFQQVKAFITSYEQQSEASRQEEELSKALERLSSIIQAEEPEEAIEYLFKLADRLPEAFSIMDQLKIHFLSLSTKKYKELAKRFDKRMQALIESGRDANARNYPHYLLIVAESARRQRNLPLARQYLEFACQKRIKKAYASYAAMCYRGEGGPVEVSVAYDYAKKCSFHQVPAEYYLDFAEIYHVLSMHCHGDRKIELREKKEARLYYNSVFAAESFDEAAKSRATLGLELLEERPLAAGVVEADLSEPEKYDMSNIEHRKIAFKKLETVKGAPLLEDLLSYYRTEPHNYELLTNYLQLNRQSVKSEQKIKVIKRLLKKIFPELALDDLDTCYQFLKKQETERNHYFDEEVSDDSDGEDVSVYANLESHYLKHFPAKLEGQLKKMRQETLRILEELNGLDGISPIADSLNARVNGAFVADLSEFHLSSARLTKTVRKDVEGFSHGLEADKSVKEDQGFGFAAKLAGTANGGNYYISHTRGIHFDVGPWGAENRRAYRQQVRGRGLERHRIYCHAAYIHSGVAFDDFSDQAMHRLSLAEKYIHFRMEELKTRPYESGELLGMDDGFSPQELDSLHHAMFGRKFTSKREQIQHLYTNHYDLFHKFIKWESQQEKAVFPNKGSPFVSVADYGSVAPFEYAVGNKYYQGAEDSRLRPRYNAAGRPAKPYAGVVTLSILRLEDLLQPHSHVVSMNQDGAIQVGLRIISERETSFIGSLPGEIKFSYNVKFPDFSVPYQPGFYLKYGLKEDAFNRFKALLAKFSNHSNEQRLVIRFLGRYLSAFHGFCLQQEASDQVRERDGLLLYRNPHGGVSLTPASNADNNPAPKANEARTRRSALTQSKAKALAAAPAASGSEDDSESEDGEVSRKRRIKKRKRAAAPSGGAKPIGSDDEEISASEHPRRKKRALGLKDDSEDEERDVSLVSHSRKRKRKSAQPDNVTRASDDDDDTDAEAAISDSSGERPDRKKRALPGRRSQFSSASSALYAARSSDAAAAADDEYQEGYRSSSSV